MNDKQENLKHVLLQAEQDWMCEDGPSGNWWR
jgi:hypothetical protein